MKVVKLSERVIFEPVTIDELKLFLKIEHDADDETLDRTRKAARQWVEAYTSRNWARKEVTYSVKGAENVIDLDGNGFVKIEVNGQPFTPVEVVVFDGVNIAGAFDIDAIYNVTVLDGLEDVPEAITEAVKKLASLYYFEREATGSGTKDLKTLLMPFRKFLFV
jgi:hypothetical protein